MATVVSIDLSSIGLVRDPDNFLVYTDDVIDEPDFFNATSGDDLLVIDKSRDVKQTGASWGANAGDGDDVLLLRDFDEGNIFTGAGADVVIFDGFSFGELLSIDENDVVVVPRSASAVTVSTDNLPGSRDAVRIVGDGLSVRFLLDESVTNFIASDRLIFAPDLDLSGVPDGLTGIGTAFSGAVEISQPGAPSTASTTSSSGLTMTGTSGADYLALTGTQKITANLGLGADVALVKSTGGGLILGGGSSGTSGFTVVTLSGDTVSVPGTNPSKDADRDVIVFRPDAKGTFVVSQLGATDRIVLEGFSELSGLSDLQIRAFRQDFSNGLVDLVRYQINDDLAILTDVGADQFLLGSAFTVREANGADGALIEPTTAAPPTDTGGPTGGADRLTGTARGDRIAALGGNDIVSGFAGNDTLSGGAGKDTLKGGGGADVLRGQAGNDLAKGGAGADKLAGGGGKDMLRGQAGDDVAKGGAGNDKAFGDAGDDRLLGGGGADILKGGRGDDVLKGGAGNDRMEGGRGDDVLFGQAGRDVFVFTQGSGDDVIRGFQQGVDKIEISGAFARFGSLDISQQGRDVLIEFGNDSILVKNARAGDFDPGDFVFPGGRNAVSANAVDLAPAPAPPPEPLPSEHEAQALTLSFAEDGLLL